MKRMYLLSLAAFMFAPGQESEAAGSTATEAPPLKIPTCGRFVHYFPSDVDKENRIGAAANGAQKVPALVVQEWGSGAINCRVFCDSDKVLWEPSVPHKSQAQPGSAYWDWPAIN